MQEEQPDRPNNVIDITKYQKSLVDEKKRSRPHLADMMALPKKYRVGANLEGRKVFIPLDPNDDLTKDQIINIIGQAYPELVSFLKEVDELKKQYAGACGVIAEMHKAAVGKVQGPIRGVVEDIEDMATAGRRAMDVLRTIAYNLPVNTTDQRKPVQMAQRFFDEETRRKNNAT